MAKSTASVPKCMRFQNLLKGMLASAKHDRSAVVCLQVVLRDDADRNRAFCVPAKHEQRSPPRQDAQRMQLSLLPEPTRHKTARDRDCGSPTSMAVTGDVPLPTGIEDGSPHALRTHAPRASLAFASSTKRGPRRDRRNGVTVASAAVESIASTPPSISGPSSAGAAGPIILRRCGAGRLAGAAAAAAAANDPAVVAGPTRTRPRARASKEASTGKQLEPAT